MVKFTIGNYWLLFTLIVVGFFYAARRCCFTDPLTKPGRVRMWFAASGRWLSYVLVTIAILTNPFLGMDLFGVPVTVDAFAKKAESPFYEKIWDKTFPFYRTTQGNTTLYIDKGFIESAGLHNFQANVVGEQLVGHFEGCRFASGSNHDLTVVIGEMVRKSDDGFIVAGKYGSRAFKDEEVVVFCQEDYTGGAKGVVAHPTMRVSITAGGNTAVLKSGFMWETIHAGS